LVARCKRSLKREKTTEAGIEVLGVVCPLPSITTTDVAWAVFIVAAMLLVFAVALIIGMLLSALSILWGLAVAFALALLVAGLLLPELRDFWTRLPR
jgi:hypothetical protein